MATADKLELSWDTTTLFTEDASRVGQSLIRGALAYRLTDRLSVGAGYTYVSSNPSGDEQQTEHRIVQDIIYRPMLDRGVAITLRLRAEERFREEQAAYALRLRGLVRMDVPVSSGTGAVIWNETFYGLNRTAWSGPVGAALCLTFVGFSIPISENMTVEPGYLDYRNLRLEQRRSRQALSVSFNVRL